MIKKQQRWIALLVVCTFMWLMQVSSMPVAAADKTEQVSSLCTNQGPDYFEAVNHRNAPAKKKSILPWILIGVGLLAVTTVILILVASKGNDNNAGSDLPGGTGEVKVTLQWTNCADLDLWVTDPCGNMIYYDSPAANCSGKFGQLDVDSNAACYSLNCSTPAENIYWVTAPSGSYAVQVNYYTPCSNSGSTSYTLTTIVNETRKTYTGSISPYATATVTSFTK
jgi:hypothetical protein